MTLEPWKYTDEIDEKIEDVFSAMSVEGPTSDEYPKLIQSLDRLIKLREQAAKEPEVIEIEKIVEVPTEPKVAWWRKIDVNQAMLAGANIVGVILLARAEKEVFVNPKALNMLHKPKPGPFR